MVNIFLHFARWFKKLLFKCTNNLSLNTSQKQTRSKIKREKEESYCFRLFFKASNIFKFYMLDIKK